MTTTLDDFEGVLNFESDFFCSADFCEVFHIISRALARFCVLAHADYVYRRLITWTYIPTGTLSSTGSGEEFLPPYMTVYAWSRTA